jgi:hypothetical protein
MMQGNESNGGPAFTYSGAISMNVIVAVLIAAASILSALVLCLIAFRICNVHQTIWKCWAKYRIKRLVRSDPILQGA